MSTIVNRLIQAALFSLGFGIMLWVWLTYGRAVGISSAIWPANVLSIGALVLLGRRHFFPEILGVMLAGIGAHLLVGDALAYSLACGISKAITFGLVGWGVWSLGLAGRHAPGPGLIARLALVALLGPLPGAVIGAVATLKTGGSLGPTVFNWWMPDIAAIALFLPPFLFWNVDDGDERPGSAAHEELLEVAAASALLVAVGWLTLAAQSDLTLEFSALALLWFAFRLGMFRTALAVSLFAAGILVATIAGDMPGTLLDMQGSLAITTLPALLIAAIMARRERERRMLVANERRLAYALEGANDGLWDWHLPSGALFFSPRSYRIIGHWPGSFSPDVARFQALIHPDDIASVARAYRAHVTGHAEYFHCEMRCRRNDGSWVWLVNRGRIVERDTDGAGLRMVGTASDISERKQLETELQHLATHDPLTGLPNRTLFTRNLAVLTRRSGRHRLHTALLLLDVDEFKIVNDTHGHAVGDVLLKSLAARMQAQLRAGDIAARIGGDEFAVIATGQSSHEFGALAERLCAALSSPIEQDGVSLRASVSIGIAVAKEAGLSTDELTARADRALYAAKTAGRNTWRYFAVEQCASA